MTQPRTTISRLTIRGFKSFANEASLEILPGLTGIVGPNGCGKSNVVEALRWVMGETSARALRGGELDDLIFAGTGARPARNLAQVTVTLAQARGLAPPPFQEEDELEISRQAERGSGSEYRLNGRVLRARDVQTLFADLASGARSSAIVSQNRVGQLIGAKPEERRLLLEEAAGITGLHARRHDAEIKLRQTEANLARAEDLLTQLQTRLDSLNEQSGQAQRYRRISEELRAQEELLLALLHAQAEQAVRQNRQALHKAEQTLKDSDDALECARSRERETARTLTLKRQDEENFRPLLENLRVENEIARRDLAHAQRTREDALARLQQAEDDLSQHTENLSRLRAAQEELAAEIALLTQRKDTLPDRQEDLSLRLKTLSAQRETQGRTLEEAVRFRDAETIRRDTILTALEAAKARLDSETATLETLRTECAALEKNAVSETALSQSRETAQRQAEDERDARQRQEAAATGFQEARLALELAQQALKNGEKQAADQAQTEKDLRQKRHAAETRLHDMRATLERSRAALLSEEERDRLEETCRAALARLTACQQAEEERRREKESADTLWLTMRAQAEENFQRRHVLEQEQARLAQALSLLTEQKNAAAQALEQARAALTSEEALQTARQTLRQMETDYAALRARLDDTEQALTEQTARETACRTALTEIDTAILRAESEWDGLRHSLEAEVSQPDPLEDHLSLPEDLLRAVASALADGLDASLNAEGGAQRHWRPLPPLPAETMASCRPLSQLVEAPPALSRFFDAVFLLDDETLGPTLQTQLGRGQSLVCRNGALWRWDGFVRAGNAPDTGATRLERRRKRHQLEALLARRREERPSVDKALTDATAQREAQQRILEELNRKRAGLDSELTRLRSTVVDVERRHTLSHAAYEQARSRFADKEDELTALRLRQEQILADLTALPEPSLAPQQAEEAAIRARDALSEAARLSKEAQQTLHEVRQAGEQARLRHENALSRVSDLDAALERLVQEREELTRHLELLEKQKSDLALPILAATLEQAQHDFAQAEEKIRQAARNAEETARRAEEARRAAQILEQKVAASRIRRESLGPRLAAQETLIARLRKDVARQQDVLDERPDLHGLKQAVRDAESALSETEKSLSQAQGEKAELELDQVRMAGSLDALHQRLSRTAQEIARCEQDIAVFGERVAQLRTLHEKIGTEPERLLALSEEQERRLKDRLQAYEEAQTQRRAAAEAHDQAQEALRTAEQGQMAARETIIRLTERAEQAVQAQNRLLSESAPPENVSPPADLSRQAETALRRDIARLTQERDALGPVNLRAEAECDAARTEFEALRSDHDELTEAVSRLRSAIGTINREGRERLMAVFTTMDRHFQSLFARMFGGGKAHLGMVGNDDPLEAGLEIFAQPPGKKLSTLSLLSGGEQALTALSLIFAAYHCTPAPICVLDEVDAPLDDANVERFCTLLEDMTREAGTRFLVVTHHQLTMAHMNRLFGVTMQERGVSQILSVDLGEGIRITGS